MVLASTRQTPRNLSRCGTPFSGSAADTSDSSRTLIPDVMSDTENAAVVVIKKRRRRREIPSSPVPTQEPMLPPCRICAERASGFHYGANTCEACKAFFRRSLRIKAEYKCLAEPSGKCCVISIRRNSCNACRLQKCIDVGMSKTAIKTGRYTHAKKAKDITEVKQLKVQQLQQQQQHPGDGEMHPGDLQLEESQESMATRSSSCTIDFTPPDLCSTSPNMIPPIVSPISVSCSTQPYASGTADITGGSVAPATDSDCFLLSAASNVEELEKIIRHVTEVEQRVTPLTSEFIAALHERQKQFLEERALKREIFGPMKPMADEDYLRIYRSTGIDIDGRRDILQNHCVSQIEGCIKRFVTFVKAIPGFSRLQMEDQIALVKASRFDVGMFLHKAVFSPEHRIVSTITGQVFHLDDFGHFTSESILYFDEMMDFQSQLEKLHLNVEENAIVAALCVFATDRCTLKDVRSVENCQALMLDCLLHLVDKYRGGDFMFIAHISALLVRLRNLGDMGNRFDEYMVTQWHDAVEFPPLYFELWSNAT